MIWPLRKLAAQSRARARFYLDLVRHPERPRVLRAPPAARRVVVMAPHPDDETIGCGGVLRQYALAGAQVTVIFVSDGRRGSADLDRMNGRGRVESEEALVVLRREEAVRAGAVLGIAEQVFLELPDGEVSATPAAVTRLSDELRRLAPEVVFLPFLLDAHPDHFQTIDLFLRAAEQVPALRAAECWAYEVWTPLYANRIVDITAVAETKWEALREYASQSKGMDYLAITQGLNTYRWLATYNGRGFAEAFYVCSLAEYRAQFAQLARTLSDVKSG